MNNIAPADSASALIDEKFKELSDWCGNVLPKVRGILHDANRENVEER